MELHPHREELMAKDRILVPVDFTGPVFEVISTAADLAGRLGADVVLLYVVQLPAGLSPETLIHPAGSAGAVQAQAYLDEDARRHLLPHVQRFEERGCGVEIALQHGTVGQAILAAATRVAPLMLIMGTHGRTGLRRLLEGSVAERVIRHASCPVLVVRTHSPAEHPGLTEAQRQALTEAAG